MPFVETPAHTAIFNAVRYINGGNLQIGAVAGSGKTTTIVAALDLIPQSQKVLFLAFNKRIATELQSRVPAHVKAQTLNSLGHGAWMGYLRVTGMPTKDLKLDTAKVNNIALTVCGAADRKFAVGQVARLVRLAKAAGIAPVTTMAVKAILPDTDAAWEDLIDHHDLDAPTPGDETNAMSVGEWIGLARKVLAASFKDVMCIDFDDQLYMTVLCGAKVTSYHWVLVDEAQDLSPLQHELVARAAGNGRVIAVGDDAQAIYGFRGACADSMQIMRARFNMATLPLHVSYRCPQAVVAVAQRYVAHIKPHADAPMGTVDESGKLLSEAGAMPGDMVLCRFTAPLVSARLSYLRAGIPAVVLGQDLGNGLKALIKRLAPASLDDLSGKLNLWESKERAKAIAKEDGNKLAAVEDKADSLRLFIDGCDSLDALGCLITKTFADNGDAGRITLSTIHKSKGLEAARVFIINHGVMPKFATREWMQVQEANLCYVAVTRSKGYLAMVTVPMRKSERAA